MPYIKRERREVIDRYISGLQHEYPEICKPQDCGELNYALTMLCLRPLNRSGLAEDLFAVLHAYLTDHPLRYQRINDVVGACECAVLELERRLPQTKKFAKLILRQVGRRAYSEIGVGYELSKIAENGDIAAYKEIP